MAPDHATARHSKAIPVAPTGNTQWPLNTQILSIYQRIVAAYRTNDQKTGKVMMEAVINSISRDVPQLLTALHRLGRTLKQRSADILAFFDRPGSSNGPTEAINGRLEHLHGTALGLRNPTHYIARSLLDAGAFRPQIHP